MTQTTLYRKRKRKAIEAYFGSALVFIVSYLFAAALVAPLRWSPYVLPIYLLLPFVVCIFWLIAFGINSLVIKVIRGGRLFRKVADRYVQDVIAQVLLLFFAAALSHSVLWNRWIGIVAMALVALNLAARLAFALKDKELRSSPERTTILTD